MQDKEIQGLLRKVGELKAAFTFGVDFVPFLEKLLAFVQDLSSTLDGMDRSIGSASGEALQAADAAGETGLAAEEILDRLNHLQPKLEEITGGFQQLIRRLEDERKTVDNITSSVEKLLKIEQVRQQMAKVFENAQARTIGVQIKGAVDSFLAGRLDPALPGQVEQLLQDVQSDAFDVLNALQVHGATGPQAGAAEAVLSSLRDRLNGLLAGYAEAESPAGIMGTEEIVEKEEESEESRALAEELFEEGEEPAEVFDEESRTGEMKQEEEVAESQEEIDELFDSMAQAPAEAVMPESEAFEPEEAVGEPASQEEIDELLDWGDVGLTAEKEVTAEGEEPTLDDLVEAEIAEKETGTEITAGTGNQKIAAAEVEEIFEEEAVEETLGEDQMAAAGMETAEMPVEPEMEMVAGEPVEGEVTAEEEMAATGPEIEELFAGPEESPAGTEMEIAALEEESAAGEEMAAAEPEIEELPAEPEEATAETEMETEAPEAMEEEAAAQEKEQRKAKPAEEKEGELSVSQDEIDRLFE